MTSFKADLHCHSTASDGSFTPVELLDEAVKIGLSGLSITDHDTIDAYEGLLDLADNRNLRLVSGVEFSTVHAGKSVHVLAYGFSLKNKEIQKYCETQKTNRVDRIKKMLSLLKRQGIEISIEDLPSKKGVIGRPHIAEVLVNKGIVSSFKEAFHEFLGDGKCCYIPSTTISTHAIINFIHQMNGYAIIAHPQLVSDKTILEDLLTMDFDGIEGYYAKLNRQCKFWLDLAKKKNWLVTGGSDFHGNVKPSISFGSSWVEENTFKILEKRFFENEQL